MKVAAVYPVPFGERGLVITELRRTAVAVSPSVDGTGAGKILPAPELLALALLEAMACGTAVIATEGGALPEVVVDGIAGFVVPPGDVGALRERIVELVDDPDRANAMRVAARAHVTALFSWDMVARACLAAYGAASGKGSRNKQIRALVV
jgi:glycosyltransferase involved in cell wall biosynthesis